MSKCINRVASSTSRVLHNGSIMFYSYLSNIATHFVKIKLSFNPYNLFVRILKYLMMAKVRARFSETLRPSLEKNFPKRIIHRLIKHWRTIVENCGDCIIIHRYNYLLQNVITCLLSSTWERIFTVIQF